MEIIGVNSLCRSLQQLLEEDLVEQDDVLRHAERYREELQTWLNK